MEEVLSMKEVVAVVDDSIVAHHNMQRKEPIPKHLFCEHVRKMHHNKDDRFKTEFGVCLQTSIIHIICSHHM